MHQFLSLTFVQLGRSPLSYRGARGTDGGTLGRCAKTTFFVRLSDGKRVEFMIRPSPIRPGVCCHCYNLKTAAPCCNATRMSIICVMWHNLRCNDVYILLNVLRLFSASTLSPWWKYLCLEVVHHCPPSDADNRSCCDSRRLFHPFLHRRCPKIPWEIGLRGTCNVLL